MDHFFGFFENFLSGHFLYPTFCWSSQRFILPDAVRGSVITAFIKKRSGASLTEDDLKRYALSEAMLSAYKRPRRYHFVESLDHTAAGKLIHRWPSGIARG